MTTPTPDKAYGDALVGRMADLQQRFPLGSQWMTELVESATVTGWDANPTHPLIITNLGCYYPDNLRPVPPPPVKVRERWAAISQGFLYVGDERYDPDVVREGHTVYRFRVIEGHMILCDANGELQPVEAWEGE
jgi:hypothetical protein